MKRYDQPDTPKNKTGLLKLLQERAENGDPHALALAYIIGDICPDDRTTKHVFKDREEHPPFKKHNKPNVAKTNNGSYIALEDINEGGLIIIDYTALPITLSTKQSEEVGK